MIIMASLRAYSATCPDAPQIPSAIYSSLGGYDSERAKLAYRAIFQDQPHCHKLGNAAFLDATVPLEPNEYHNYDRVCY